MILSALKEYVFEKDTVTPSCHASTVLPLDDGSVLAAWFGGKHEKDADVEIYVSKRDPDGKWSAPAVISEKDSIPHWNPVLYRKENGDIVLFYKYGEEIPFWITKFVVSSDNGESWSAPQELVKGDTSGGRGPVKNKCLKLSNGILLAPASTEQKKWIPFIDRSEDDGLTWNKCDSIAVPKYKGRTVGLIQPTLWEAPEGTVHALMRSDAGAIYASESYDFGRTWSKAKRTRLPNNNSGIDCCRDDSGRIWLLYNPVGENWGVRHPLSLAVSTDNGVHFREVLLPEPGNGEFSYPTIVCRSNCLYISYTYKRKQIVFWKIELEE